MLSNGFDAPLHLNLKYSKFIIKLRVCVHLAALTALSLPMGLSLVLNLTLYIIVLLSLGLTLLHYSKTKHRRRQFCWHTALCWIENRTHQDKVWECQIGAIITPWFVIVKLSDGQDVQSLLISRDQCEERLYRRLCVRLKYT